MAEGNVEYESDPEEVKLSLKMRRREASDDEEERERWGDRMEEPPRRIDDSEGESEGAAAEYEDDMEEYYVDGEYVEGGERHCGESGGTKIWNSVEEAAVDLVENTKDIPPDSLPQTNKGVNEHDEFENSVAGDLPEEKNKKLEPFTVPTAGAFYMHDDRFRDNAGGRNRRMLGGRRLWESKDERKWGHDKFEQFTGQERHHGERGRSSKGRFRGRGRNHGTDRVYTQVNKLKDNSNYGTASNNNQGNASKGARGRGPHKYQPFKNYDGQPITRNKLSEKPVDNSSNTNSVRASEHASNAEPEKIMPRKQVGSNLNVASPPFYPTGSSTNDNNITNRRDVQSVSFDRSDQQSVASKGFVLGQSSGMMSGKTVVDSINVGKLYIDDQPYVGRPPSSMQMPLSGSLAANSQPSFRSQGRGVNSQMQMSYQTAVPGNQVNRVTSPNLHQSSQRNLNQFRSQTHMQASIQQFAQRSPSGAQSSPPKSVSEWEESVSASETNQSKTDLVTKGKEGIQGSAKGSFMYGGPQVIGPSGSIGRGHTDQNFPAFLPVMQFGGQHPGGIGVPAVGMAFPGYVGQPGSSEMTWLPLLAGAAGALGAAYCPPYITVDGSYNSRAAGPASSISHSLSKENNGEEGNITLSTEEVGQRQKNPLRYTEMKFDK